MFLINLLQNVFLAGILKLSGIGYDNQKLIPILSIGKKVFSSKPLNFISLTKGEYSGNPVMKILVVEDSNSLRYMICKMLKEFDYRDFSTAETAEEALSLIEKKCYDLVLLDWSLPKMSGFEFLKHIRADSQYDMVNVVMVTTMYDRKNILQALKIGLQGYILKPLDSKVLLAKIKEVENKLVQNTDCNLET